MPDNKFYQKIDNGWGAYVEEQYRQIATDQVNNNSEVYAKSIINEGRNSADIILTAFTSAVFNTCLSDANAYLSASQNRFHSMQSVWDGLSFTIIIAEAVNE